MQLAASRHDAIVGSGLDRLIVLSVSFRDHGTSERERLGGDLAALRCFAERCIVQTCHRIELIALLDGDELPPLPDGVRIFRAAEAVERVFVVAAGLDSAILAEEQVLGQVRDAYGAALSRGETGPFLNELLRRAVRFGKRVRSLAQPAGDRSLADHAARWALARLDGASVRAAGAVVVGTGEMSRIIAARFAAAGMRCTIVSRSLERAARLAEQLPRSPHGAHEVAALEEIDARLHSATVAAFALRRPAPVLTQADGLAPATLVIDLSSPPAVANGVATALGDRLLDLDALGQREEMSALPPRAERQVRRELGEERDRYVAWLLARRNADEIASLHRGAEEARSRHIEQLKSRVSLGEAELAAVERMTTALVGELVHLRTVGLREGLLDGPGG